MPNALITGLGGQDGYYMAALLLGKGYRVTGTIRPGGSVPDIDVVIVETDMRDAVAIQRAIDAAEPDEVYNFAGVSSLAESDADPDTCIDINAGGPRRLLDAIGGGVRICQASSALIFGPPDGTVRDENTPVDPRGPYARAKAEAHHAIAAARDEGRFAVSAILFNHESPLRSTRFVSRKITRGVAEIKKGMRETIAVRNLGSKRDWGFAGDYVRAMWMSLQQSEPQDLLIATGVDHSIRDLARTAFEAAEIEDWEDRVEAELDHAEVWSPADPSRTRAVLGWAPEVDFRDLVGMMVRRDLATV